MKIIMNHDQMWNGAGKTTLFNCISGELKYENGSVSLIENLLTIDEYFDIIKIKEEDRYLLMKGYSHGMKNKMQMVCLLITKPAVILLDEPLTSFDVVVALEIKNLLKRMKSEHIIIFSTHILQLATDLCDEILVLNNCILEEVDSEILKSTEFEEKIMEILKEKGFARLCFLIVMLVY